MRGHRTDRLGVEKQRDRGPGVAVRSRPCDNQPMPGAELLDRISVDPAVCGGKPCIRGHRIWVALLLDLLADGMSVGEVLAEYPQLEEADVRAALAYAAKVSVGGLVELTSAA